MVFRVQLPTSFKTLSGLKGVSFQAIFIQNEQHTEIGL